MMRKIAFLVALVVPLFGVATTSDCGGKLDVDASVPLADVASEDNVADGPYEGQCCNIYDGSTARPCDHDVNEVGFGDLGIDGDTYFCGYDFDTLNLDSGVGDWRRCAYTSGHRWLCCVPADPTCCPKIAEPDDAGNPPAKPGTCNGIDPADGEVKP